MSIYKRASGKYAVVIATESGSLKRKSLGVFRTRKEAEAAEREGLTARERGIDISPARVTVDVLLMRFLADCKTRGLGAKTIQEYEGIVKRAIKPHLGGLLVAKLRPARISAWHATLTEKGGQNGSTLSARSVRHADALLRGALSWGVRIQLASVNAAGAVRPPTFRRSAVRALDSDEVERVLEVSRETRWGPFVALLLATAARRGEMIALDWSDFDADRGTITIRASMSDTKAGVERKGTKTDRVRVVPLAGFAIEKLRRQRVQQAEDKLRAGEIYETSNAIFTDERGYRYKPMQANDAYRTIATKADVPTGLHALRHTAVSLLLAQGTDVRTVAGVAGHSTPAMTLNVYGHLIESAARAGTDRLGSALEKLATKR